MKNIRFNVAEFLMNKFGLVTLGMWVSPYTRREHCIHIIARVVECDITMAQRILDNAAPDYK